MHRCCDATLRVARSAKRALTLLLSLLIVHIILNYNLAFEEYLENTWKEYSPWRDWVIFMTEVVPLLPLVDENAQIRRVLIQSEQQFVKIVSRERCF